MNKAMTFQEFLATQSVQVSPIGFLVNLLLAFLLSWILGAVYVRFGRSLSNRHAFASNFPLITMTTMLVISIVKSSLALSLGLVGALSIVRFRAAIKEPEELSYLFLSIAVGLGLGADQRAITLVAFVLIVGIQSLRHVATRRQERTNLFLSIASRGSARPKLEEVVEVLRRHCAGVQLRRFDETPEGLETTFQVELDRFEALEQCKSALQQLNGAFHITFLDHQGIAQ